MDLHIGHGHIDIGGEDRDEEQRQAPSGQILKERQWNEQAQAAEQLKDAADQNAGQMKRDPRRHDRKEEGRVAQMDRSREEKKRGQEQANEKAEEQERTIAQPGCVVELFY